MKTSDFTITVRVFVLAAAIPAVSSQAQTAAPLAAGPAPTSYVVVSRDANSAIWERTTYESSPSGWVVPRTHRVVEMATGLNFKDPQTGQWTPSKEEIDILPDGTAVANHGQHTVSFPADIAQGVIELTTPDGMHLKSRPLGIFFDDGSRTVLIAALTNAVGYLAGSNQVVYPDAFTGVKGDLVMTYRRSGFESDVVLREQPPAPDQFGLSQNARLQLLTEFFNPPEPVEQASVASKADGLADTTLQFGSTLMKQGRAFAIGTPNAGPRTPVYKSWLHLNGRTFLVEEVPYRRISAQLQTLPVTASSPVTIPRLPSSASHLYEVSATRLLPPANVSKLEVGNRNSEMIRQVAEAALEKTPGLVLDYNQIDYDQTDITFQSGVTYYVSSQIGLFGTATFQGDSVIKFDEQNGGLQVFSAINNQSDPSHPTVLTSRNDNSVGDIIPGSSGQPGQDLTDPMDVCTNYIELKNFRFNHANFAFFNYVDASTNIFWNCEFSDCGETIDLTYGKVMLRNVLNFYVNFYGSAMNGNSSPGEWYWLDAQNVTSGEGFVAYPDAAQNITLVVTNSILVGAGDELSSIAAMVGITYAHNTYGAADVATSADFESAGNANCYLAANSTLRDAGTTNIDPDLLAELQTMTTYAPQDGGYPDTNTPDLGYHYPVNEDSDYDGLPDWWEWKYFGSFSLSGTNLDGVGNTLLDDYNWDIDPNFILFSLQFTNSDLDSSSASGTINHQAGVPFYEAVLVNDTNLNDAVWQPFTSTNLTVSLSNGLCTVSVGLNGLVSNARQTWREVQLTVNTTALSLTVTNPASSTVYTPLIQLQGYASKPFSSLTYDISNAVGMVANQPGYSTSSFYDTNWGMLTTNYFECYDLRLTNGLNTITLHSTDLAGNTTAADFNFTLVSGDTNPPALSLIWPQNGMKISGSNFTAQAQVDDATATATASMNGNPNTLAGVVERSGRVWFNNLPLAAGPNTLTITVTNAAGNMSTTNIEVVQSPVMLTIDPISAGQRNQSRVTVTGTVSDPDGTVIVNGIQASVDGSGNWTADNVPVSPTGTASLDVEATDVANNPLGSQTSNQPQAPMVVLASYQLKTGSSYNGNGQNQTVQWDWQAGGSWSVTSYESMGDGWYIDGRDPYIPPDGPDYTPPVVTSDQGETFAPTWQNSQANGTENGINYQTSIKTKLMIVPGGQTEANGTALYLVQLAGREFSDLANDWNIVNLNLGGSNEGDRPMPPEWLQINGQTLVNSGITNDDGSVVGYALVSAPAGAVAPFTVTATQHYTNNDYTFNGVQATNVTLQIFDANTGTNLSAQINTVIVGQQINLTCQLSVTNALLNNGSLTNFQWTVPGITFSDYVATASSAILYTNFPMGNSNVVFYWSDSGPKQVQISATVNGNLIPGQAWFNVLRPTATVATITGDVALDGNFHIYSENTNIFGLHYGNVTAQGIKLFSTISIPSGFSGSSQWVQVINSMSRGHQYTNGVWYLKQMTNVLDEFYPYASNTLQTADSPGEGTDPTDEGISASDNFSMWFMFKPVGGQWVPLRVVNWNWSGVGSLSGTNWVLTSSANTVDPTSLDSATNPQWNGNFLNYTNYVAQP